MPGNEVIQLILQAKDLASESINKLRGGMEKLSDAGKQYQSTLQRLSGSANEFKNTILKLGAAVGVAGVARSFIEIASSAEKTRLMLAGLMGSTEKATEAFNWLLEVSTKAPFSIGAMKDAFIKLQVAGLDPMRGSLETLMDAISAFGGSDQDLQLAAVAIQQMAGKGVISMEELRQQLGERVPSAMKAMAEGMGMSIKQLVKTIESGNLSATEGLNAMMGKFKEWYGGTGVRMMNSWTGLISNLKVAWEKFVLMLAETGIFDKLKSTIEGLLKKIEEMKETGELKVWGDRITTVVNTVISVVTTLAGVISKLLDTFGPFLPAIAQAIIYFKLFQIVVLGPIGMIGGLIAKMFALKDAIKVLAPAMDSLKAAFLSAGGASGILSVALKIGLVGAAAAAGYAIGSLIDYLIRGKKEQEEFAKSAERMQQAQQELARNNAELDQRLTALGFTTGSVEQKWHAFNKALKEGIIIWDEQEQAYKRVEKATGDQKKTYEELINKLKVGSEQFITIKNKELVTLKATIDFEISLEEARYKKGEISLEEFLKFKERRQEDYVNRMLYLLDMELEALKKAPEENLTKIAEIEEKKKQILLQSKTDQIKIQEDFSKEIIKINKDDLSEWKSLQELKLQTLESQLDLQNTIEETMVQRGIMRQSELLQNQIERLKQFYAEKIRIAEETMSKIIDLEGDVKEYNKAMKEREKLQQEFEAKIIASEQLIFEARQKEELDALRFVAEITGDRIKLTVRETEDRIKELKKYYDQGLIDAEQYYDALSVLEEQQTSEFKLELKERTQQLNQMMDIVNERRKRLQEAVSGILTEGWEDVKQYFGDWKDAVSTTVADVQQQINTFMQQTTWKSYDTFWNASMFGRKLVEMVGTSIYEWSQRVTDYINYVKSLLASLQEQIESYRMQLLQLRGDRLAELEMWYSQELKKLEDKYKDELGKTAEYYEALAMLLEIYKEKKKKLLEEMAADEEEFVEKKKKYSGGMAGAVSGVLSGLLPDLTGMVPVGAGAGTMDIKVLKESTINASLEILTFDKEYTKRWFEDTLWPLFERKMELMGEE